MLLTCCTFVAYSFLCEKITLIMSLFQVEKLCHGVGVLKRVTMPKTYNHTLQSLKHYILKWHPQTIYLSSSGVALTMRVTCTTISVINLESNISSILRTCALFLKLLIHGLQRICEARNVISSHSMHHVFQLCNSNNV
jgi:hypothetical protein